MATAWYALSGLLGALGGTAVVVMSMHAKGVQGGNGATASQLRALGFATLLLAVSALLATAMDGAGSSADSAGLH